MHRVQNSDSEEGIRFHEIGVADGCELPCTCRNLNSVLQEQLVTFPTESPSQPLFLMYKRSHVSNHTLLWAVWAEPLQSVPMQAKALVHTGSPSHPEKADKIR